MNETLDMTEAAELLKISASLMQELASTGVVIGARVGKGWVFIRQDLMDYLRAETRRQTNERRAAQEADKALAGRTPGMPTFSPPRRQPATRKLPDLDKLEAAHA